MKKRSIEILLVALVYYVTARIGQLVAIQPGNVTPVWIPSGIMLAAVFVRGYRIWPGIFLGAFCGNVWAYLDTASAQNILKSLFCGTCNGIGDVCSAVGGACLVTKTTGTRNPFLKTADIIKFICYGAILGPAVSALFGITSLCAAAFIPWENYLYALFTWFAGDGVGALILAPMLVLWMRRDREPVWGNRRLETALFFFVLLTTTTPIFGSWAVPATSHLRLFLVFPLCIWAVVRLPQLTLYVAIFIVAAVSVTATANGLGPFSSPDVNINLIDLQFFIACIGVVFYLLGGNLADRKRAEVALEKILAGLEQQAQDRTAELATANEKLTAEISEHKQTITALKKSEDRFAKAMQATRDGVWDWDSSTGECYFSPGCYRLLGYEPDEFPMTIEKWIGFMHPDDQARTYQTNRDCLENRKQSFDVVFRMKHKSGQWRWILGRGQAIGRDARGNALRLVGTHSDIHDRQQAEEAVRKSLGEKEVLLREIHHRVKNNLQVITSLLKLQARTITDKQSAHVFQDCQERIKSMALIHETLYQSGNLDRIDFAAYAETLVTNINRSCNRDPARVTTRIQIDDVYIGIDSAVPCGLIINELVSNALKHAFPAGRTGEITVAFRASGATAAELTVRDTGVGIPGDIDLKNVDSLGLKMVHLLAAHQLGAAIELDRTGGTAWKIRFTTNPQD